MKRICALFILMTCLTFSQNKQVLYGFSEIPQSLLINPGVKVNNKWHMGIPLLSQIHGNFGMSGVSAFDVFADDGRDFSQKLEGVINSMKNTDFFAVNQQLEIFSGGFEVGKGLVKDQYLSFGMYQESDIFIYFPKDYAILAFEGNTNNINRVFNLGDLNVSGELISVFHLGLNKKINNKLMVGARGKIYSSVLNFNSTKNKGRFITRPGTNNFYEHIFNLDLELKSSGAKSLLGDDNSEFSEDIKTITKRMLFGGNLGLGFDVGLSYQLSEQWAMDASLQDIGFIAHTKDIENYKLDGDLVFDGINPIFLESGQGQTADEYWDEVAENFEDLFTLDTTATKYATMRPIKFNGAVRYSFGKKVSEECNCTVEDDGFLNAVGAQLFIVNRPKQPQTALTAYYYRRLMNQLRFKATYTVDTFSFTNIGVGVSAHFGSFNFYTTVDNLLEFQNLAKSQSVSLQLGFNLIFDNNE